MVSIVEAGPMHKEQALAISNLLERFMDVYDQAIRHESTRWKKAVYFKGTKDFIDAFFFDNYNERSQKK